MTMTSFSNRELVMKVCTLYTSYEASHCCGGGLPNNDIHVWTIPHSVWCMVYNDKSGGIHTVCSIQPGVMHICGHPNRDSNASMFQS